MMRLLGSLSITFLLLVACQAAPPEPGTGDQPETGGPGPISDPEPRPLSMVFQENQDDPHISIFSEAVLRANLGSLLSEPSVPGDKGYKGFYTAFVPTDAAFETYFQEQGTNEQAFLDRTDLTTFVKAHIVEDNATGKVLAADSPNTMTFETLSGGKLALRGEGERCFVENRDIRDCVLIVNGTIQENQNLSLQQKYRATNGAIIVINKVLTF